MTETDVIWISLILSCVVTVLAQEFVINRLEIFNPPPKKKPSSSKLLWLENYHTMLSVMLFIALTLFFLYVLKHPSFH